MYDKGFWKRANISQFCEFIKYGVESFENTEKGTFKDRHHRYVEEFISSIFHFRDIVLKTDWDSINDDNEREMKTENMYDKIINAQENLCNLAFEVGMIIGFQFYQDFTQRMD